MNVQPHPERSFALRLSYAITELPCLFWEKLNAMCEGIFAVEHNDGSVSRPHIHMAIWNARLTHDSFRKNIVKLCKETIADDLSGNSMMSLKRWNSKKHPLERYLVYMLKGEKHKDIADNSIKLSAEYIQYLRDQWTEDYSDQRTAYGEFIKSPYCPVVPPIDDYRFAHEGDKYLRDRAEAIFDTIVVKAKAFSLSRYGGFINPQVVHEAKFLISNYCHFNKIKMRAVYI